MKTTILIGYHRTDASGNPQGAPKIIAGPPADDAERLEQAQVFTAAKQRHVFPKGVRWVGFGNVEVADSAAFISEAVADEVAANHKRREEAAAAARAKVDAREKAAKGLAGAHRRVGETAVALNNHVNPLNEARKQLAEAERKLKLNPGDDLKKLVEETKAAAAAAETKHAELKKAFEAAKDEVAKLKALLKR